MTIKMKYESVYSTEENLLKKKEKTEEEEEQVNLIKEGETSHTHTRPFWTNTYRLVSIIQNNSISR